MEFRCRRAASLVFLLAAAVVSPSVGSRILGLSRPRLVEKTLVENRHSGKKAFCPCASASSASSLAQVKRRSDSAASPTRPRTLMDRWEDVIQRRWVVHRAKKTISFHFSGWGLERGCQVSVRGLLRIEHSINITLDPSPSPAGTLVGIASRNCFNARRVSSAAANSTTEPRWSYSFRLRHRGPLDRLVHLHRPSSCEAMEVVVRRITRDNQVGRFETAATLDAELPEEDG
mmetsp:Transcript_88744/g.248303  ORF Transcript_88744/g.248303 Transcript_88744/m.248303 type:complete len:231 (-) Transcript_88744:23-715(-)